MNKPQGQNETSPKEKEKLKKRLQTLFEQQANGQLFTSHSNKIQQKGNRTDKQMNGHSKKSFKKLNYNVSQMKTPTNEMKESPIDKSNSLSNKAKTHKPKQNVLANNSNSGKQNQKKIPKSSLPSSQNKNKQNANLSEISKTSTLLQNDTKPQANKKKISKINSLNSSTSNDQQINNSKKAEKRTATTTILNSLQPKGKKSKLTKKLNKTKLKKNEELSHKPIVSLNNNEEYDLSNMSGFVKGGDWMQNESDSYNSEDGDSNESNVDSSEDMEGNMELIEHVLPYDSDEEEDDFDSDEDVEDFNYSEEEDAENYSDFDENDYEEDEDSFDYSFDSDENSSNYDDDEDDNIDTSYDFENDANDGEYNLPKHVLEDLIIHRGTATKHDLKPEDNIVFNSDNEEAQIIELEEQQSVNVIKQPEAYDKEEILKLKYEENTLKTLALKSIDSSSTTATTTSSNSMNDLEDCPKLVPIVDEDGFQLYNPNDSEAEEEELYEDDFMEGEEEGSFEGYEDDSMDNVSLGSEYVEINSDDADSMLSEDINEKYLNRGEDTDSDSSVEDSVWIKQQKVNVIDATSCKYVGKKGAKNARDNSDASLNDDIQQIPSQKLFSHVDLNSKCSYSSTTIIDTETSIENDMESCYNMPSEIDAKSIHLDECTDSVALLHDPEDNETIPNETEQPADLGKTTSQNLDNYNTKFFNALDSNIVLVLMKDPFYIYGTVRLTLLAGALDVYGHSLSLNNEVEIFSPRGCSVIELAAVPRSNSKSKDNLEDTLKMYEKSFALADLKLLNDSYDIEKDAIVLLKRNEGRRKVVQQFKKFMNENVFPNINNINMDRPLYNTEYLLRCMINTSAQAQKCLRLPTQWQQLSVRQQSRIMLTGGKGVGKSTLLRFLINRHLPKFKQILLIDLDIGQPEIFVPQTVSCSVISQPLLGPGFLLNLQTDKSYAVGHTNIALCAHKYLEAVRTLISHCLTDEKYKELPWLINTMGYNKGFGLELMSVIANKLPLTDVIQLQSSKDINNFDSILFPHVLSNVPRNMFIEEQLNKDDTNKLDYRLHVWQSAVQQESRYLKEWEMSAKDLRYAILLARLSEALQGHAEWLTDCKPLSAPLHQIKIVDLTENSATASQQELAKVIEANLVYLCRYEDANKPVECFGIGIVRGIDFHVHQLYLIPAMKASLIKHVNCLAIGAMPLPTSILTNQGSRVKNLAPFVYNTIGAKSSKAIKQIYHRPRKFLTGLHKSIE